MVDASTLALSHIDQCLSSVHLLQICSKMEVVDKPESYKKLGTKWQGNGLVIAVPQVLPSLMHCTSYAD